MKSLFLALASTLAVTAVVNYAVTNEPPAPTFKTGIGGFYETEYIETCQIEGCERRVREICGSSNQPMLLSYTITPGEFTTLTFKCKANQ